MYIYTYILYYDKLNILYLFNILISIYKNYYFYNNSYSHKAIIAMSRSSSDGNSSSKESYIIHMVRSIRYSDEQCDEGGYGDHDACKCTMNIIIGM